MTEDKIEEEDTLQKQLVYVGLGLLLGYFLSKIPDKIVGYESENKEK